VPVTAFARLWCLGNERRWDTYVRRQRGSKLIMVWKPGKGQADVCGGDGSKKEAGGALDASNIAHAPPLSPCLLWMEYTCSQTMRVKAEAVLRQGKGQVGV
jgi:hypothetical protein